MKLIDTFKPFRVEFRKQINLRKAKCCMNCKYSWRDSEYDEYIIQMCEAQKSCVSEDDVCDLYKPR